MSYSRAQLFDIAHQMGHRDPSVYEIPSSGKFFATCSCGWISTSTMRFENALRNGVHHALSAATVLARQAERSGVPLTAEVIAEAARRQQPPRAARPGIPPNAELVAS